MIAHKIPESILAFRAIISAPRHHLIGCERLYCANWLTFAKRSILDAPSDTATATDVEQIRRNPMCILSGIYRDV
jgi:hypothetical protein